MAIRPYDVTQTPNIYVHAPYAGAITSNDLSVAPYMIPVPSTTKAGWLNFPGGSANQQFVCEFVTDVPHETPVLRL